MTPYITAGVKHYKKGASIQSDIPVRSLMTATVTVAKSFFPTNI